jgi:cell division protein FtsQ
VQQVSYHYHTAHGGAQPQAAQPEPQMARLDPRASRAKYRMERLMLTPLFRFALRALPVVVVAGIGALWLANPDNRETVGAVVADLRDAVASRPEFQVKVMAIDGANPTVDATIRQVLPIDFPISSLDLPLEDMQEQVIAIDAVETAELRIVKGVLQIDVTERVPALLWRGAQGLVVLDKSGAMVGPVAARAQHVELPVIAGEGAEAVVGEALALFEVAGPLRSRLRGFERMGERRWDVVLDRDQRIMLPETGAVRAFERTIAMDQAVDMLSRDLLTVDLRLPHRPTVRMTEQATQEMWRIKAIEAGGVPGQ